MKFLCSCIAIVLICFIMPSCKKKSNDINIPIAGSPFTQSMCGSHNFNVITAGWNPILNANFTDTSSVSEAVTNDTFYYDSTSASGVLQFTYSETPYAFSYGYLYFNHIAGTILVSETIHMGAAAGDWEYNYSSY